ncbi:MAG: transposase [Rhodospirillaceae bacterium]|nr:transposase [Rhodospirillaceae bacterium]
MLLYILTSVFKSPQRLAAENVALRHQILVLKRKHRGRIKLRGLDRVILGWLARMGPTVADAIIIVKPKTLVRWHRLGFQAFWRWKSGSVGGRPPVDKELRALILRMAAENPLWGAPRIHGELLKLGFELSQATVSNYIRRHPRPRGQTRRTFIDNHRDAIAATDLFVVPTIGFKLMYGIVIVHLKRRELVWTNAIPHPTAEWIAQQITEAFLWERAPSHLIRDRDASFGAAFKRRLNSLGIRDHPTAPRSPWQNGYAERIIGSIRRECLDHTIFFGEAHLRRTLKSYANYYNRARTHLSLAKDSPVHRPVQRQGNIIAHPHLAGLHHEYARTG